MPEALREGEREGAAPSNQGVFPVLQHGLCQLRIRLRGQRPRGSQKRGPRAQAGHR